MRAQLPRARATMVRAAQLCLLAIGLWGPTSALATPVTYLFTGGSVDVTGSVGATTVFSTTGIPLSGTSVVFDAAGPTIDSFSLVGGPSALIPITPAYGGIDGFTLDTITLSPGTGYSNISVTGGPSVYPFTVGPIDAVGTATGYAGAAPVAVIPFAETSPAISGTLDIGSGTLTLMGITLVVITGIPGETTPLVVKGDVMFTGMAVPEPAALGLLALFGVASAIAVRRKR